MALSAQVLKQSHQLPSLSQRKFTSTELGLMSRGDLQALAKACGISANQKSTMIIDKILKRVQVSKDFEELPVTPMKSAMAGGIREVEPHLNFFSPQGVMEQH